MATFEDFLSSLKPAIAHYAKDAWDEFKDQAEADGNAFVDDTEQDLRVWTIQLASHEITLAEFKFNVDSKKALAKLTALKQQGLAKAQLDEFVFGLVNVIVDTAEATFLA